MSVEWCDCDWTDNSAKYGSAVFHGGVTLCGCGEQHARGFRDDLVHWRGRHWRMECAFDEASKELERVSTVVLGRPDGDSSLPHVLARCMAERWDAMLKAQRLEQELEKLKGTPDA